MQQSSRRSMNPSRALLAPRGNKRNSLNCSLSDALASFSNIFTPKVPPRGFIPLRVSAIGTRTCSSPSACDLSFAWANALCFLCSSKRKTAPLSLSGFRNKCSVLECVGVPSYAVERERHEMTQVEVSDSHAPHRKRWGCLRTLVKVPDQPVSHHRRAATADQIASTIPNGQAP